MSLFSRNRRAVRALARVLKLSPKQLRDVGDFLIDDANEWAGDGSMREERAASYAVGWLCHRLAELVR